MIPTIAGQCIVGIRNTDNARGKRNLLSGQSMWVTTSIVIFMMRKNYISDKFWKTKRLNQLMPEHGMLLDHNIFGFCQAPSLIDDKFVYCKFSNIMDGCREFEI